MKTEMMSVQHIARFEGQGFDIRRAAAAAHQQLDEWKYKKKDLGWDVSLLSIAATSTDAVDGPAYFVLMVLYAERRKSE